MEESVEEKGDFYLFESPEKFQKKTRKQGGNRKMLSYHRVNDDDGRQRQMPRHMRHQSPEQERRHTQRKLIMRMKKATSSQHVKMEATRDKGNKQATKETGENEENTSRRTKKRREEKRKENEP